MSSDAPHRPPASRRFPRRQRLLTPPAVPAAPVDHAPTRVLLECAPHNSPGIVSHVLQRAGFDVVVCEGPADRERCPVACGGDCRALGSVDVVVNMLGTTTPGCREVLGAVAARDDRPPVVAMVDGGDAPPGVRTFSRRATADQLARAVRAAIA